MPNNKTVESAGQTLGKLAPIKTKLPPRYPTLEIDRLKIFFGDPLVIDEDGVRGVVTVKAPTIGDILAIGESRFYSNLSILVGNTTQFRLMLWEAGIDWNTITDFQLFIIMYKQLEPDVIGLLFDNIDFQNFEVYERPKEDGSMERYLYDKETDTEITELVYQYFHQYLQNVFNMKPERELTPDKMLKEAWIRKDQIELRQKQKKGENSSFSFVPLISTYINHPGTKHSLKELREVGVAEFFDSLKRIQVYEHATAVLKGMYSGFVNSKDIDPSAYDFAKDI
jgi:hypothetical protein